MKPSKGDSKNRWVLSVKMWGVFSKGRVPCKPPMACWSDRVMAIFQADQDDKHEVRPVTVSWVEKK